MKKYLFILFSLTLFSNISHAGDNNPDVNPLDLEFQRLAVRRFIFSNNLILNEFIPYEIVSFKSMHPAFSVSENNTPAPDKNFRPQIKKGKLVFNKNAGKGQTSICVGGINPYATYELDIEEISNNENEKAETGIELAQAGLRNKIQVIVRSSENDNGIYLKTYKDAQLTNENKFSDNLPSGPFKLRVQLYGRTLGIFTTQYGETKYIGHVLVKEHFGDIADFRKIDIARESTFNIISNLQGEIKINKASSYLSPGIGQADIRMISYEDLSPYMENGRLWFTFSCRGLDTPQSAQGILSLDPSVFDIKFEGMVVFDHGDGLLRNDYASHIFYDRNAKEWRAYACDFGGTANLDRRSNPGLITACSSKTPLRGFSIMRAKKVDPKNIEGHNEDPCIFYDKNVKKWRLLTSAFVDKNITSRTYESDKWDGKFTPVAMPIRLNSTGTSIQKIGNKYYALMGGHENLRIHSYPDLKMLGELKLRLQPHWPNPAGRIWASVVPLPEGYPYRYVLLTMDRPNFPAIKGANWSYGALYFYGANPSDISSKKYEY